MEDIKKRTFTFSELRDYVDKAISCGSFLGSLTQIHVLTEEHFLTSHDEDVEIEKLCMAMKNTVEHEFVRKRILPYVPEDIEKIIRNAFGMGAYS